MWDGVPLREDFNSRAFDLADNELYDVDDYLRNDTASEYLVLVSSIIYIYILFLNNSHFEIVMNMKWNN